jgi:hypothetical protein
VTLSGLFASSHAKHSKRADLDGHAGVRTWGQHAPSALNQLGILGAIILFTSLFLFLEIFA